MWGLSQALECCSRLGAAADRRAALISRWSFPRVHSEEFPSWFFLGCKPSLCLYIPRGRPSLAAGGCV